MLVAPFGKEDATTTTTAEENNVTRPPLLASIIPDVFRRREEEYGNAARSVSALVLYSPQQRSRQRFRGMYVWARYGDVSTHTDRGESDRLVPPRLRRAAHLLTEYHRDSYIATIVVHTPAMRTAGWPCFAGAVVSWLNPEARSRSLAFSLSDHR